MGPVQSIPLIATPQTPVTLQLLADYFEGEVDFRAFRTAFPHLHILSSNPLVVSPGGGRWVYLARFGAAVFWNCPEDLVRSFQEGLARIPGVGSRIESDRDTLAVEIGHAEERVGFSEVQLRELGLDQLKIISLALAQSVALDHLERSVGDALAQFQPVVRALKEQGRVSLGSREVLRIVGFALETRARVLEDLTLFDDPPETWESEALAHLDSALFGQFDLEERVAALGQKLTYLADAGSTAMTLLTNRKSHRLEWIIIALITFEIAWALVRGH